MFVIKWMMIFHSSWFVMDNYHSTSQMRINLNPGRITMSGSTVGRWVNPTKTCYEVYPWNKTSRRSSRSWGWFGATTLGRLPQPNQSLLHREPEPWSASSERRFAWREDTFYCCSVIYCRSVILKSYGILLSRKNLEILHKRKCDACCMQGLAGSLRILYFVIEIALFKNCKIMKSMSYVFR